MTRRALRNLLATLVLAVGPPALAQGPAMPAPTPARGPDLGSKLFPPS